jgi:hypothetical protein
LAGLVASELVAAAAIVAFAANLFFKLGAKPAADSQSPAPQRAPAAVHLT